jgi:hypothetical protein
MSIARIASFSAVAAMLLVATAAGPARAGVSDALKCAFAKQKLAVKETGALLACDRKALAAQTAVDPACTAAAVARFEAAFQKIEMKGGCAPAGDVDAVEFLVDRCTQPLEQELQGACQASGATCGLTDPPCCTGLRCGGVIGQPATCHP